MADQEERQEVLTPRFRASYANVWEPQKANESAVPKYSIVMLFDKSEDLSELKKLAEKTMVDFFTAEKAQTLLKAGKMRSPFRDGDVEKSDKDGYKNAIFVSASSVTRKPGIVGTKAGPDGKPEAILSEAEFYSGCYARATVTCYGYDKNGNQGVAFGLRNIQKLADGEHFGGGKAAEDSFDAIGGEEPEDAAATESSLFSDKDAVGL